MTNKPKIKQSALTAVGSALSTLISHKEILYPFAFIAFVQLFVLEILYFYPRFPLSKFFGPLVSKLYSPEFMHYPANFQLLPKLFQSTQIPLYVFISSFFIGVAVAIIATINSEEKLQMKKIYRTVWRSYVHLVIASLLMFLLIIGVFKIYGLVFDRALMIQANAGIKFWIKTMVISGAPIFQFFISVFVTVLFAYVIPIIIIDKKNVFAAIARNFKVLFRSFFFTLFVVLVPSLLYVLVLLIRFSVIGRLPAPEWSVLLIILNILVLVLIDAIVYTAISTFYLLKKESQ